ncbi:MAG: hypothetical protein HGB03_00920 [Candidatus Yonathbacteria bacterium]|nr:hypothetical protein [Candidatus Yonathbacteria bacterium]NTW47825.1 hypothetical protein [Candidatus Yonathbacteria bacterium]
MSIQFRFALKSEGNNPYLSIYEEQTPAEATERLVNAEFCYGSRVTKVTDTVLVLRTTYMGRHEIAVFQGPAEEMKKLVALATIFPRAIEVYHESEEYIAALAEKVEAAAGLVFKGVPKELALLVPVNSEGWQVLQRSLLSVFGATEEEMNLCVAQKMAHKTVCAICEMVEEGIFASFTEAFAYAKAS